MAVGCEEKTGVSQYLPESAKTSDFNLHWTLSKLIFVIPEHLVSIHSVVLAFTANKQTNKHFESYI